MNNEEKMLLAMLSPKNMDEDLPDLLAYMAELKTRFEIVNKSNKDYILGHRQEILNFILQQASEHFYASKLKVYLTDEDDEDEGEIVKMSEEETKEKMEEVMSHPLFMTSIPEEVEGNPHLEALQAIKYDETPEEIGIQNLQSSKECLFKYRQHKLFKDLKDAMITVTNGIDHCNDDHTVNSSTKLQLLLQRADLNILVKNWKHSIDDLNKALNFAQTSKDLIEIFERMTKCYICLNLFTKAEKTLEDFKRIRYNQLQSKEIEYKDFQTFEEFHNRKLLEISKHKTELENALGEQEAFKRLEKTEKEYLYEELSLKGIKIAPQYHKVPVNCEANIFKDDQDKFYFPILVVYEEFNVTDYMHEILDDTTIGEIILMLTKEKLPWDKSNNYTQKSLRVFYEMSKKDNNLNSLTTYYYPLKDEDTVMSVLTKSKVIMNGFPVISIVSTNSKFFDHFLKTKIILKR